MTESEIERECERRTHLLNAFETIEKQEKSLRRLQKKEERRYERQVRGWAVIDQIGTESLRLTLESGETLKVAATREICDLIQPTDTLSIFCGLRDKRWRILFVDVVMSSWPAKPEDMASGQ